MKIKVRGDRVYPVRDVRVSRIKPFRDEARLSEPGYVHSLPPAPEGRAYVGRDDNEQMKLFLAARGAEVGEGDDDEEIEPPLPPGSYHAVTADDGAVHIYRQRDQEGEEQPPANVGSPPITNMPSALAGLNATNDRFWRDQMSGAPNGAQPNAKAIAAAISRVMSDGVAGGTADSAMHMQAGLKAMNSRNRQHYSSSTHDAGGPPKGPVNSPAAINQRNRQRWQTGRQ